MGLFGRKRTKEDVKSKTPFSWGNKTKKGKQAKSGTVVEFNDGQKVTLLSPSGKGTKFASELAMGVKVTNDGEFKLRDGQEIQLTPEERAYRGGYLDCLKDNAKAFNAKKAKKANKQ